MRLAMLVALLGTTALMPLSATAQQQTPVPQPNTNSHQQVQSGQQQNEGAQQSLNLVISQMRNQTLFGKSGQEIGRITRVVQGQNDETFAVVSASNGQVLVPTSRLAHQNNRLIVTGADSPGQFQTHNQQTAAQYRDLDPNFRIVVVAYDMDPANAGRSANNAGIVVQQAAPTVRVDPADPRVIVRQQQPQVTVNQAQPEIIVRQPQPTVRVDIPQPEIIVRMPQPDVNVAMAQPDVRVLMERPDVSVVRPGQPQVQVGQVQPQVMLQRSADAEPNVQVQQAEGQPTVRYERAKPRVVVNQAQGQPNVRFERQGQPNVNVQQQAAVGAADADVNEARAPVATGAVNATANVRPFRVSALEDMDVYSVRGQQIGEVKRVVRGLANNQSYIVLEHGGFLGLGEKEVPIPLNRVFMMGDRLVAAGMTEAEVDAMRDWDFNSREYGEIGDNETIEIGLRG